MNRLAVSVIAGVCFLVLVGALGSLPSTATQAQGRPTNDVNVVNTPTVNAQQSGAWNVGIAGTPTVNAQQSGPWDVGVSGLTNRITSSVRAVILAGQTFTNVSLATPNCPAETGFLVTDVLVAPEVLIGATSINVVQLGHWAISISTAQFHGGGANGVFLNALGNGAETISASLPAGQRVFSTPVNGTIVMLGGVPATARHEFNVHLTGFCGVGFVG